MATRVPGCRDRDLATVLGPRAGEDDRRSGAGHAAFAAIRPRVLEIDAHLRPHVARPPLEIVGTEESGRSTRSPAARAAAPRPRSRRRPRRPPRSRCEKGGTRSVRTRAGAVFPRRHALAPAADVGLAAGQEKRDVASETAASAASRWPDSATSPELAEQAQCHGGVSASAAETRPDGDVLGRATAARAGGIPSSSARAAAARATRFGPAPGTAGSQENSPEDPSRPRSSPQGRSSRSASGSRGIRRPPRPDAELPVDLRGSASARRGSAPIHGAAAPARAAAASAVLPAASRRSRRGPATGVHGPE